MAMKEFPLIYSGKLLLDVDSIESAVVRWHHEGRDLTLIKTKTGDTYTLEMSYEEFKHEIGVGEDEE